MELWYESLDYSCITPKSLLGALRETGKKRVLFGWKKTVLNWQSNQYIFTSLPLFSSLYTPLSPTMLSFISKRRNKKRVMSVGGKLRTWPGTQVELSWTRKQCYWTFAHKSSPILKSILHLHLHTLAQKGTKTNHLWENDVIYSINKNLWLQTFHANLVNHFWLYLSNVSLKSCKTSLDMSMQWACHSQSFASSFATLFPHY